MHIRPDAAKERDLIAGDWAWIETTHGRVMQKAKTVRYLDPPRCTFSEEETRGEALGSWPLGTLQCKVYGVKGFTGELPSSEMTSCPALLPCSNSKGLEGGWAFK
jgi:anaerobic selenocysteine-containing dehydrogenase